MAAQLSAGIALWRRASGELQVLLVHFGGPYWARKDAGAWGIPKGLVEAGETAEDAARREFQEELGHPPPRLEPLLRFRQRGGKWVEAFAAQGDLDPGAIASITFEMEWPRGSGRIEHFPEVDRAAWFGMAEARAKILPSQLPVLDALEALVESCAI